MRVLLPRTYGRRPFDAGGITLTLTAVDLQRERQSVFYGSRHRVAVATGPALNLAPNRCGVVTEDGAGCRSTTLSRTEARILAGALAFPFQTTLTAVEARVRFIHRTGSRPAQ